MGDMRLGNIPLADGGSTPDLAIPRGRPQARPQENMPYAYGINDFMLRTTLTINQSTNVRASMEAIGCIQKVESVSEYFVFPGASTTSVISPHCVVHVTAGRSR